MIELDVCEPFIMVCPTYYYDYETRAVQHQLFPDEVRNDLMPAAESKYSTYAPTADEAGFIASRDHRAFAGYSQGCMACWNVTYRSLDYAKWHIPMSGSGVQNLEPLKDAMNNSEFKDDLFFILCCGGKRDLAYEGTVALTNAMIADDMFSYGLNPAENNFCTSISKEIHQTMKGRINLYNVLIDVLFK